MNAKDSIALKECISNIQNVMNVGIKRIKLKIKDGETLEFKDVFISLQNQKLLEITILVSSSQNIDKVDLENI
jgi:hypothetical protein